MPAAAVLAAAVLLGAGPAGATPASVACGIARLRAIGRLAGDYARCFRRDGIYQASESCLAAAVGPFRAAESAALAGPGCLPSPPAFAAESHGLGIVSELGAVLRPGATPPDDPCAQRKLRAAMRSWSAALRCHRAALADGAAVARSCLDAARDGMKASFAAAEAAGGCHTSGDRRVIHRRLVRDLRRLLAGVPVRDCADLGGAPTCGGPCPGGEICRPSGGEACSCAAAPCLADAPACGASCPDGGSCAARFDGAVGPVCTCTFPTQPCGETAPACDGACPVGTHCGTTSAGEFTGTCGCVPDGAVACTDAGGFPACGGSCPDGSICAGVSLQVGAFFSTSGCACGPAASCESGLGIACPVGLYCWGVTVPGLSLRGCRAPD